MYIKCRITENADTSTSSVANRIPDIHRDAAKLPSRINAAEECDATEVHSSNAVGPKNILIVSMINRQLLFV